MKILRSEVLLLVVTVSWILFDASKIYADTRNHESIIKNENPIAFPGAEGYGRFATGGRGGRIIYVTNLNDSGEGSFRQAVEVESGPRIVLFNVSGNIELESRVTIRNGNITIAGQTAPGDGITIRNQTVYVGANNVIIRFLRFRMGDVLQVEDDALWGRRQNTIIIDHCTMSWATDEATSFYDNSDFTMQWCIISESLRNSLHEKGSHGYMGIWGGKNATFHHNLLAHHDSRNPRFCGSRYSGRPDLEHVDFRNNVIYNWGGNSGYAGEGGTYNMVNNYYKAGPGTRSNRDRIFQMYPDNGRNNQPAGIHGVFYTHGNYVDGFPRVTADNWIGMHRTMLVPFDDLRSVIEFDKGQISTHSAYDAFEQVLNWAGACLVRDAVDSRVVNETREGTFTFQGSKGSTGGIIDSQDDVGGWPDLISKEPYLDTDGDGIPDWWEIKYGLDPENPDDGNNHDFHSFYTNVEVYINSIVQHIVDQKNIGAKANYIDVYDVFTGEPEIVINGDLNQTVLAGESIQSIVLSWEHAREVMVNGLPQGIDLVINNESNEAVISGTPLQSGFFEFDITTLGGIIKVSKFGSVMIENGASLIAENKETLVQRLLVDTEIADVVINFENATEVIHNGLPDGLDLIIDTESMQVFLSGTISDAGVYSVDLTTEGGSTYTELAVLFYVYTGGAEIIKHGAPSSNQEIEFGEAIEQFFFRWENAEDVEITGLPDGVVVIKDYEQRHAILRGRPLEVGIYDYVVRTYGGLTEAEFSATFTIVEPVSNSILTSGLNQMISVHPNPFDINVTVSTYGGDELRSLQLYSTDGRLLREEFARGLTHKIHTAELPTGIYFLRATTIKGDFKTIKLIKR
ncbi:hypothetical protein CDL62_14090 [Alkalitalea saponilacus]|nr:hypothetical protein CDL62_14090 [Alkalitalea saponilacus]